MSNEKMYIDVSDIFKVSDTLYHSTKIVKQPEVFNLIELSNESFEEQGILREIGFRRFQPLR